MEYYTLTFNYNNKMYKNIVFMFHIYYTEYCTSVLLHNVPLSYFNSGISTSSLNYVFRKRKSTAIITECRFELDYLC